MPRDHEPIPVFDRHVKLIEHIVFSVIAFRHAVYAEHDLSRMRSGRKSKSDFFHRFGNLDALYFIELFLPLLRLRCLCRFCAEASDKFFEVTDFLLLLFVRSDERFQFGLAHRFVVRKVSRIAFEFAAEKFVHFGNADVEKIAVVADEQKSAFERL